MHDKNFMNTNNRIAVKVKKVSDEVDWVLDYGKEGNSGFDLRSAKHMFIEPGKMVMVPTGFAFEIPQTTELQVRPRSGVTIKTDLDVRLGTVDSNYRGEVSIMVKNDYIYCGNWVGRTLRSVQNLMSNILPWYTPKPRMVSYVYQLDGTRIMVPEEVEEGTYVIHKGDRLAQMVLAPVLKAQFVYADTLSDSDRGPTGFGESGIK